MDVIVHGNNLKITDTVKEYAQKKVGRLDRFLPNITEIQLDLSRQNTKRGEDLTIAQITLRHGRGAILRAEEKLRGDGKDAFEAAINAAVDKMYRRIERFKGKRSRKGRERAIEVFGATEEELSMAEELPEFEVAEDETIPEYDDMLEILRRKEVMLEPMSESDAIEQMELLGHTFFMFLNRDTDKINVLYRRSSDGYGVLVPVEVAVPER